MFSSKRSGDTEPLIDWACLPDNDDHGDKSVDDESTDPSDYDDDVDDEDGRAQQIRSDDGWSMFCGSLSSRIISCRRWSESDEDSIIIIAFLPIESVFQKRSDHEVLPYTKCWNSFSN